MSSVTMINREPRSDVAGLIPPHDLRAEEAVIASCMIAPEVAASVVAVLTCDDFYSASNRALFEAIGSLVESGSACDLETVAARLRQVNRMKQVVDGERGMVALSDRVAAIGNPLDYARTVAELARRRQLILAAQRVAADAYTSKDDLSVLMARSEKAIGVATEAAGGAGSDSLLAAGLELARTLEANVQGTPTGYAQIDQMTTGMQPAEMWVLAARTGMGKTALSNGIGIRVAESGKGVLFVSLEMRTTALMMRIVSARARIPLQDLRHNRLTDAQHSRLQAALSSLGDLPFWIYDKPGATLRDIYTEAQRVASTVKRAKLGLVIVDHLGLVTPATRGGNREAEVSAISRGLKVMAGKLNVPILALVQVGREVAKGARRPELHDLRESGAIEQDADCVIGLHRPSYYEANKGRDCDEQMRRYAEAIVLKQRQGETGIAQLDFDGQFVAFDDARPY